LQALRPQARSASWACTALALADSGEPGWRELAAEIAADEHFARRPTWHGAPAETGPWTRQGRGEQPTTVWERLGARLADLAAIADGAPLSCGALGLAPGEAIAWSEMARGLLVHWVQLDRPGPDPGRARIVRCHVLAPTEWNFHPDGAFARWLRLQSADGEDPAPRLAALALDPCLACTIEAARGPAAARAGDADA
jgi:hypothetical protein